MYSLEYRRAHARQTDRRGTMLYWLLAGIAGRRPSWKRGIWA